MATLTFRKWFTHCLFFFRRSMGVTSKLAGFLLVASVKVADGQVEHSGVHQPHLASPMLKPTLRPTPSPIPPTHNDTWLAALGVIVLIVLAGLIVYYWRRASASSRRAKKASTSTQTSDVVVSNVTLGKEIVPDDNEWKLPLPEDRNSQTPSGPLTTERLSKDPDTISGEVRNFSKDPGAWYFRLTNHDNAGRLQETTVKMEYVTHGQLTEGDTVIAWGKFDVNGLFIAIKLENVNTRTTVLADKTLEERVRFAKKTEEIVKPLFKLSAFVIIILGTLLLLTFGVVLYNVFVHH